MEEYTTVKLEKLLKELTVHNTPTKERQFTMYTGIDGAAEFDRVLLIGNLIERASIIYPAIAPKLNSMRMSSDSAKRFNKLFNNIDKFLNEI
jgi:hypothetical protein